MVEWGGGEGMGDGQVRGWGVRGSRLQFAGTVHSRGGCEYGVQQPAPSGEAAKGRGTAQERQ